MHSLTVPPGTQIHQPQFHLASSPTVVAHPSWMTAMTESVPPSLKGTVNAAPVSGLPVNLSGPVNVVPASPNRNFSFSFTPHPTYWITFGNYDAGQVINVPTGNVTVVLPPNLKA